MMGVLYFKIDPSFDPKTKVTGTVIMTA